MRPGDRGLGRHLDARLRTFHDQQRALPGILDPRRRSVLVEQMVESHRRVRFVAAILDRDVSAQRADPANDLFDPLKAAIHFQRMERIEEAFWLVFLFVHFGRNAHGGGWRYAREVYGALGGAERWHWETTSANPEGFRAWLNANQNELRRDGVPGGFGNHRKRQSLDALHPHGTGSAFVTYVNWVGPARGHQELIRQALQEANGNPRTAFQGLYESMADVASFGRLAKFDYLTMLGKLGLAQIEPGSPYLVNGGAPLRGARLLFGNGGSVRDQNDWTVQLGDHLGLGMQVMEDSLCNWQKNPDQFVRFRG